ncbi:MAG: hypothetical protein BWK80_16290 [Desulfobacteraceae bacterium IS3]|nr:MAG: hypothetical protein BWK80_16290 [Desulfobacteraceae bacterium IS3]
MLFSKIFVSLFRLSFVIKMKRLAKSFYRKKPFSKIFVILFRLSFVIKMKRLAKSFYRKKPWLKTDANRLFCL